MIAGEGTSLSEFVWPLIPFVGHAPNRTANRVSANLSSVRERPFDH